MQSRRGPHILFYGCCRRRHVMFGSVMLANCIEVSGSETCVDDCAGTVHRGRQRLGRVLSCSRCFIQGRFRPDNVAHKNKNPKGTPCESRSARQTGTGLVVCHAPVDTSLISDPRSQGHWEIARYIERKKNKIHYKLLGNAHKEPDYGEDEVEDIALQVSFRTPIGCS